MKEKNEKLLKLAIEKINEFGIKNNDIMILGSIALDIAGLFPLYRDSAHDVDVMIRCDKNTEDVIVRTCSMFNKLTNTDVHSESSTIVLNLSDCIINFWFVRPEYKFNTMFKLDNGVWVEKPIDCIKKKKSYRREKDYRDINNIIFQIVT